MKLSISLDSGSISEAVAALEAYASKFEARLDQLCRRLAEMGVDVAVANVPVDTGELKSSIFLERRGDADYLVVADNGHAAFVEFGTGVVGQGTYAGDLPGSWGYDERRTPEAHDPIDPTKWYYRDPKTGIRRGTRGHAAQPYMLPASDAMRQAVLTTAREVFAA